ncbi:N-acetylglucosamine-6-phosphate deacetylase [Saccharophagus degradans]|uniref:N-acetylglucosamine-6-phosphate deacetylase n=1 Tax=Saccharophagus degradans TaxID=86304 RepID=UPI002477E8F2|nr:N-acetylglucosamine-6-phosphate deacetylase [Saccharophagus degradans]WGO99520.1 N-acetylglucosamine-6-phosphate deacetylase [Saccharophagus degradans]
MITALINAKLLHAYRDSGTYVGADVDGQVCADEGYAVIVAGDYIRELVPVNQLPNDVDRTIDLGGNYLAPGFFDTQVNGGGGVLFNDAPTVETLVAMSEAHKQFGTSAMLPTLISDDLDVMRAAIAAVNGAIEQGVPGIVGIHLEGPFLNPARKGVHNANKFKVIDDEAFDILTSLKKGKTLVTLAPEQTDTQTIKRLADAGVVVAAGHTAATYEQTCQALDAGLTSFTHLFNAMTPMSSREPGVVGAALQSATSWCGIIVDGFHVHPATLAVAIAAKPKGKVVLVTDAMPTVGAAEKVFTLNGEVIRAENGRCATADDTLAGSDLDMLAAVKNTVNMVGIPLEEAVKMASQYPADMMGLGECMGRIAPGYRAQFTAFDADFNLVSIDSLVTRN